MTAALLLRGASPQPVLHTTDAIELRLIQRGLERASELRQQELDYLARAIANNVARAFSSKS